jgi:hypothetical protein
MPVCSNPMEINTNYLKINLIKQSKWRNDGMPNRKTMQKRKGISKNGREIK